MLEDLPPGWLLTDDAGFVGDDFATTVLASGCDLLVRVGANITLLRKLGYSRDQPINGKQVCIALVVSKYGMPPGYQVFAGNSADMTTVEHIVEMMEARHGKSDRIRVMDRGMASKDNIEFLQEGGRRYIIGTPTSIRKRRSFWET